MSEWNNAIRRAHRYCDRLDPTELEALHRVVSKRMAPIYRERFAGHWETGVAAGQAKQRGGYHHWLTTGERTH